MAAQRRIVFFNLQLFSLRLLISSGGVARRRLAFLARLGALNSDNLPRHALIPFPWRVSLRPRLLLRPRTRRRYRRCRGRRDGAAAMRRLAPTGPELRP